MMEFEQMNDRVSQGLQDRRLDMPDGLTLAEMAAWQGLVYLYTLYRMERYDRNTCLAIKDQMRAEYEDWQARFDRVEQIMACGIAMYKLAERHPDVSAALLRDMASGKRVRP